MTTASSVNVPTPTTNPFQGQSFSDAYSGISNLGSTYSGLGASVLPQAQTTASNLYSNPGAGSGIAGAWGAQALGIPAAYSSFNTGASLLPYATQIEQTGMDPQQALYNRTLQQVQDQSNVNNAMAGVATTPYGAGLTNQATSNFNIDWQNQQLARETQAGQAASALDTTGTQLMNQAPSQLVQSAMIPYATYSDIGQGQNQALSQLLGIGQSGANLSNMSITDLLNFLGVGNQASGVANQAAQTQLNQANSEFSQLAQIGTGAGNLLAAFL